MDIHHVEDAHGQGAGFVKNHSSGIGQRFQVVGTFDQDAGFARAADSRKEAQRDADDQCAGAADDQEGQGPVNPVAPIRCLADDQTNQGRKQCQRNGAEDNHRGVIPGEAGDKVFRAGFTGGGVLHQIQHFADGGFTEDLGGPDAQQAAHVDAAADDFISRLHIPGNAFTGQGAGVQAGFSILHNAVQRDLFPGIHRDDGADFHLVRIHLYQLSVLLNVGIIRPDVHQLADIPAAFAYGIALEQFADLVKQHYGDGLVIIAGFQQADGQGAEGGHGHEKVFIENLAVQDALPGLSQDIIADDKVGNQPEQEQRNSGNRQRHKPKDQHQCRGDENPDQHLLLLFCHMSAPLPGWFTGVYPLKVYFAILFHLFAGGKHILHNGRGLGAFVKFNNHFLGHEVDGDFFYTGGVPGSIFHLIGAVCAVHFDFVGLFHGNSTSLSLRLNNRLIV